ncbi:hypothetical protein Trydic_g15584 [Trypoxylus dichotomus]
MKVKNYSQAFGRNEANFMHCLINGGSSVFNKLFDGFNDASLRAHEDHELTCAVTTTYFWIEVKTVVRSVKFEGTRTKQYYLYLKLFILGIKMADQQQFFLKWNDFQNVTLACEGQTCKAHKMVLSACSPYFKSLLEENPSKHPIIILKDVAYSHLQAILEFMYAGEVNVSQEQLPAFLKTADRLKVKGLAEAPQAIKRE